MFNSDNCQLVGQQYDWCEYCNGSTIHDIYFSEGGYYSICRVCDTRVKSDDPDTEFTL